MRGRKKAKGGKLQNHLQHRFTPDCKEKKNSLAKVVGSEEGAGGRGGVGRRG